MSARRPPPPLHPEPPPALLPPDTSLLDVIDNVLNKGVVIHGEVMLGVAGVDLVYLRVSALLSAVDRVFQDSEPRAPEATPPAQRGLKWG